MRRFKSKRKLKKRAILKLIIILILIILIIKNLINYSNILKEKLTNIGLNNIGDNNNILDKIYVYTKENIINKPNTMLVYNLEYKDNKTKTDVNSNYKVKKVVKNIESEPLIYIYSSHQKEDYEKDNNNDYNINPGVFLASQIFKV